MDFDFAAQRFARDHSKMRKDASRQRGKLEISSKAKKEAEVQRALVRQRAAEKQAQQRELEHQQDYVKDCERSLKLKRLGKETTTFQPTSIHGDGDKIALPPSVLAYLTSLSDEQTISSPWTFRIGLLNPDYKFPASPMVQGLKPPDENTMDFDSDDDEEDEHHRMEAYIDELRHKYLAYTHGSVIEFTQEEGQVGLPESIASVLLNQAKSHPAVRVKRTVDPASSNNVDSKLDPDDETTPGHLAWGAFDIPDMLVEVTLVELPKGTACTLTPTLQAIQNGFYGLSDIKLILEQSLVRTRATLSVGDVVHTWNRGKKFDLLVSAVSPNFFNAIGCVNADIEVEFGQPPSGSESNVQQSASGENFASVTAKSSNLTGGRTLMEPQSSLVMSSSLPVPVKKRSFTLVPEPPLDQTKGVCVVQVRMDSLSAKRRFDISRATISDLYDFAESVLDMDRSSFRLVTRFPRRVMDLVSSAATSLEVAGIAAGQELLLVERL